MFAKTERTVSSGMSETAQTNTVAEAIKEASGAVKNNATVETIDFKPVVDSFDFTIKSTADAVAVNKTINLFNTDFLEVNPTRNNAAGDAGGVVTVVPGDGKSGKIYDRMVTNSFGSKGLKIGEIILKAKTVSTTVGDESFFDKVKMQLIGVDGEGNTVAKPVKWNLAASNQASKDGLYRMKVNFRLNYLSQVRLVITPDTEANISFVPADKQD